MEHFQENDHIPIVEVLRIFALESYEIIDTLPEDAFDRFVVAAAKRFNAPISLISFVDCHRQWFKARIGLGVKQTPREHAFCAHVIELRQSMIVRDARLDERFQANPLVTGEPGIRFYAGAPLVTPLKRHLGTLCVIDTIARPDWTDRDTHALEAMAAAVMVELERRRSRLVIKRAMHERAH